MDLFHKQTVASDFIKQLLATTPLPNFKTVREGDILVPGTKYIFSNKIIELASDFTDALYYSDLFLWEGALTPRADLYNTPNMYRKVQNDSGEWVQGTFNNARLTTVFTTKITDEVRAGIIPVKAGDKYISSNTYFTKVDIDSIPSELQTYTDVYMMVSIPEDHIEEGVILHSNLYFTSPECGRLVSVSQHLGDRYELVSYTDDVYRLEPTVFNDQDVYQESPHGATYGLIPPLLTVGDDQMYYILDPSWASGNLVMATDIYLPIELSYAGDISNGSDDVNGRLHTQSTDKYTILPEASGNVYPTLFDNMRYYRNSSKVNVLDMFNWGENKRNISSVFRSNSSHYDADTHKALGNYLRCLRDLQNIDLMCLYNCFDYEVSVEYKIEDTVESGYSALRPSGITNYNNATRKIYFVPVQFNRTYTLAFDCDTEFKVLPCLLSAGKQVTRLDDALQSSIVDLQYKVKKFNRCSMRAPVKFTPYCSHPEHQKYERVLYLAVEVPVTNNSSFVVLEGDFTNFSESIVNVSAMSDIPGITESILNVKPSLFQNDKKQHAFSDVLISYLLEYTIDSRDILIENIERLEKDVGYTRYGSPFSSGQWDPSLQCYLYRKYHEVADKYNLDKTDVTGFVDAKMEYAIRKGWMHDG